MRFRHFVLAAVLGLGQAHPATAQQRDEEEAGWVGFVEGIETCLADKRPFLTHGYGCIGRFSAACLAHAENQTTAGMERCYLDEYRAWDVLLNRHYRDRPRGRAPTRCSRCSAPGSPIATASAPTSRSITAAAR